MRMLATPWPFRPDHADILKSRSHAHPLSSAPTVSLGKIYFQPPNFHMHPMNRLPSRAANRATNAASTIEGQLRSNPCPLTADTRHLFQPRWFPFTVPMSSPVDRTDGTTRQQGESDGRNWRLAPRTGNSRWNPPWRVWPRRDQATTCGEDLPISSPMASRNPSVRALSANTSGPRGRDHDQEKESCESPLRISADRIRDSLPENVLRNLCRGSVRGFEAVFEGRYGFRVEPGRG